MKTYLNTLLQALRISARAREVFHLVDFCG